MFTLGLKKQVQDLLLFDVFRMYSLVETAENFNEYWMDTSVFWFATITFEGEHISPG